MGKVRREIETLSDGMQEGLPLGRAASEAQQRFMACFLEHRDPDTSPERRAELEAELEPLRVEAQAAQERLKQHWRDLDGKLRWFRIEN